MKFFAPKNLLLILGDIVFALMSVYAGIHLRFFSTGGQGVLIEEYFPYTRELLHLPFL